MRVLPLMAYLSVPMLGVGLTGCTVGPDYQGPEMAEVPRRTSPETPSVPSRTVEGEIDQTWWKSFQDPHLSSLVERLVAQNLDLETAAERVIQSVASAKSQSLKDYPTSRGNHPAPITDRVRMARSLCSRPRPARHWSTACFTMA